jgi:hypothetical protein
MFSRRPSLTGEALSWFFDLQPNLINSYEQLIEEFSEWCILCLNGYCITTYLFKMEQGEKETLK